MRLTRRLAAALTCSVVLAVAACSPQAADGAQSTASAAPATHPESGLQVVPLTIIHAGKRHVFRVELARTGREQAKGLMFRTKMGADEGMLFPIEQPRDASFWMKNTVMSLDIIFIGVDGRISNIAANTVPYSEAPVTSVGLVKGVLELNAGRAAELGIAAGDRVEW